MNMKTIGLIGGMSWESSAVYYEYINKKVRALKGGFHSCKSIMVSVDFAEIERLQHENNWKMLTKLMVNAAKQLEIAGADILVLCTNTMHLCSDEIIKNISIPFLHIAEATGKEIVQKNIKKVALIGTKFTMEKDFYKQILTHQFGIEVLIPTTEERQLIHDIIYNELVVGKIENKSKTIYKTIISNLEKRGAKGVILGCTEIPLLISNTDVNIPIFNTTKIHAEKAVEWALRNN
ncbi:aspartate/glutamate racemase family protein [Lutibacter sp.]|uniref:aspartate/glutamate racemase family protein n=1 Tax=Lutibacter sp. TaxID=1925666 RepID=UPI0025C3E0CF|nr:aspartate/glutamate racemase family protein [Lutibacter sp.]MCF6169144.1 aspartate/glutamate racemase family protein [Lutibacter sp.]